MTTLRLHSFPLSGHAHRARLMLALLGLKAEVVDLDLRGGAQKQPGFLGLNAFGQVPVLEDGETVIADSNAILVYLAGKYDRSGQWLPADPATAAQVQRWLSVAAGQLLMGPARARMVKLFGSPFDHDACKQVAAQLFEVMEQHLQGRDWLAASHATIADLALYSYTAHAPEGDVSLEPYPNIRAWVGRVENLPGFVPMQKAA
ncbi:MAG: glutathione S-transferase [Alphaproteobacteria bacterium]|nr:glutathione S-transferase [Alphaproteobacteria bacterium]